MKKFLKILMCFFGVALFVCDGKAATTAGVPLETGSLRGEMLVKVPEDSLFNYDEITKTAQLFAEVQALAEQLSKLGGNSKIVDRLGPDGKFVPSTPKDVFTIYLEAFQAKQVTAYVAAQAQAAYEFARFFYGERLEQERERVGALTREEFLAELTDEDKKQQRTMWLHYVFPKNPTTPREQVLEYARQMISERFWYWNDLNRRLEQPATWSIGTFSLFPYFDTIKSPGIHEMMRVTLQLCAENTASFWESVLFGISQYKHEGFTTRQTQYDLAVHPVFRDVIAKWELGGTPEAVSEDLNKILQIYNVIKVTPELQDRLLAEAGTVSSSAALLRDLRVEDSVTLSRLVRVFSEMRASLFDGRKEVFQALKLADSLKDVEGVTIPPVLQARADALDQEIGGTAEIILSLRRELEAVRARFDAGEEPAPEEEADAEEAAKATLLESQRQLEERLAAQERQKEALLLQRETLEKEHKERLDAWKKTVAERRAAKKSSVATGGGGGSESKPSTAEENEIETAVFGEGLEVVELGAVHMGIMNDLFSITPVPYDSMIDLLRTVGLTISETQEGHKAKGKVRGGRFLMKSFHIPHPSSEVEDRSALKAARELLAFIGYDPST